MFRNTGANAFAKNQTRLAYEDKRDLYCKIDYPNCRLYPLPVKFKWDIDGINKYKSLIHNSKHINIFNTINDVLSDPNEGILKLSDVLLDTANESLITKRVYDHKKTSHITMAQVV